MPNCDSEDMCVCVCVYVLYTHKVQRAGLHGMTLSSMKVKSGGAVSLVFCKNSADQNMSKKCQTCVSNVRFYTHFQHICAKAVRI